ncbi:MAG TPA: AraC family transcriptional regulator [Aliidongia sp.]|nr:AraC family transcriptional regulator [Aliidongia sp.]
MDALSDVLRVAHLTGGVFLQADFFEPWCIATQVRPEHCAPYLGRPMAHMISFHYVIEGSFQARVEGGEVFELAAGEIVLFPRNDMHFLGSHLDLPPVLASDVMVPATDGGLSAIRLGGNGAPARIICGFLGCDGMEGNPLISTLPPVLHLDVGEAGAAEWVRSTFQYAAREMSSGRPGSETLLAKLSELLFVQAMRRYVDTLPPERTGWLAGLRDPHVARSLALFHGDIARAWTVDDLGRAVGLSRSALADRFTRLVGQAPMHYLSNWRMQVAAHHLRNTSASLTQVAERIGYDSEAAFSRAFKRAFGAAPATWRRRGNGLSGGRRAF